MPDIEFHEITGQIEDVADRYNAQREEGRLDADPEALQRQMRDVHLRMLMLAERLMD